MSFQKFGDDSADLRLGAGDILTAGDGDDTVSLAVDGGNLVVLGNGNDLVFGGAAGDTITLGNGRNTVDLIFGEILDTRLVAGDGANTIVILAPGRDDVIQLGNGNNVLSSSANLASVGLGFGDGSNSISLGGDGAAVRDSVVTLGNGKNSIIASAMLLGDQLRLGNGDDSIRLIGILNAGPHANDVFTLGDGNDTLDVSGNLADDRLTLGSGNDSVKFTGLSLAGVALALGDGNDTLAISGTSLSQVQIAFGDGAELISLGSTKGAVTISAGDGQNSLSLANAALTGSQVTLGDGDNQISLSATSGAATISAGNGSDLVRVQFASLGGSLLTLGDGSDGVQLFSTTGNLTIQAGGGSDTIQVFNVRSGAVTIDRPSGAAPAIFDYTGSPGVTGSVTVTNLGDVIFNQPAGVTVNAAVDGFKPANTGNIQYVATAEAIAAPYNIAQPLPYFDAGLLFTPVPHQAPTIGVQAVPPSLSFSFMQRLPSYATAFDANGFQTIGPDLSPSLIGASPQQILAANASHAISLNPAEFSAVTALADWQAVANIQFVAAADSDAVQFRFGSNNQGLSSAAYSYVPLVPANYFTGAAQRISESADVYLNNFNGGLGYAPGGFGGLAAAHEIGHGLGLGGESGDGDPHDGLPFGEDTLTYTVMTHHNAPINGSFPIAPQVFDIAVIQYLYGPSPTYHPNASHVWSFSAAGGITNLVSDGPSFVDTISAGFTAENAYLDLRPGHWDYLGRQRPDILAPNQLMIDYGTTVQVAIGGFGDDTLVGNDADDSLFGGGGNDLLVVGPGNDTLDGGDGVNTALFADALANYTIATTDGVTVVTEILPGRQGRDELHNVQVLQFSDQTVSLTGVSAPPPSRLGTDVDKVLIGTGPTDTLVGGAGNDSIAIAGGNDLVIGGPGDPSFAASDSDTINAGTGNSTIIGGSGADSITVGDGNNLIWVHDPTATAIGGSTVRLGDGADTVLAVGGGDTIFGGGGLDLIDGGSGSVSIQAGSGRTVMTGGAGASTLAAGSGAAIIVGLSGRDSITGGTGGDTIFAAGGIGANQGDTIKAGGGKDFITLGPGSETVFTTLGKGAVSIDLGSFSGDGEQKTITLGAGAATLILSDASGARFAPSATIKIAGYQPGVDHFILRGLAEHTIFSLPIQSAGADASITVGDVGTILLLGVAASKIGAADFAFA